MRDPAQYQPHRYASADGALQLFARIYPGEGPTLLLMHGLTRNSADFEPLIARLDPRYRLIVADQRGRGLSDYDSEPANYRPDVYAADMFALLDGLGVAEAGLIGTSMGGLMAMLMAAIQPARVRAIVLNDVGPKLDDAGLDRIKGYVGASTPPADWQEAAQRSAAINGVAFPDFGDEDWMAFARRTSRVGDDGVIRLAYDPKIADSIKGDDPATVPADLWPLWDALSAVPTLVARGALSDLLSVETVAEMARRHSGPFAAVDVPNRGHAPLLDEPAALDAITEFLQAHIG